MPDDPSSADDPALDPRAWASGRVDAILDAAADQSRPLEVSDAAAEIPERRHEPRYSLEEPAQVEVGSWAELLELYTKDISRNGLFVQTSSPPEPGAQVGVHLLLPDGAGTIRFQGEVAHVIAPGSGRAPGFGVRLYDLSQDAAYTLQWIVAQAKAATETPRTDEAARRREAGVEAAARRRSRQQAEQDERSRLRAVLCRVGAQSDLDVLGLEGSPSLERIDQAYRALERQWDPHRHARDASPEVARLYKAIHFRIERAYHRLRATRSSSAEAFARALDQAMLEPE
ncbi:MAG: PilZ domain-containing protein [Myxococcales bacterium]|nr:PilZ domain-containing protein [Myxococcales bacterium]